MLMDTSGKRGHNYYQPPRRGNLTVARMLVGTSGKRGYAYYAPPRRGTFGNITRRFNPYDPADKANPKNNIEIANENEKIMITAKESNIRDNINVNKNDGGLAPTNETKMHIIFDESSSESSNSQ